EKLSGPVASGRCCQTRLRIPAASKRFLPSVHGEQTIRRGTRTPPRAFGVAKRLRHVRGGSRRLRPAFPTPSDGSIRAKYRRPGHAPLTRLVEHFEFILGIGFEKHFPVIKRLRKN